jgi:hypothetical protein
MLIVSNIEIDYESLNREKNNQRRNIDPILTRVLENEYITQKNNRLSELDILKINALNRELEIRRGEKTFYENSILAIGRLLFYFFILGIFYFITQIFFKPRYLKKRRLIFTFSTLIVSIIVSAILYYAINIPYIILTPIPMFVLIMGLIYNPEYSLVFTFFLYLLSGQFLNWDMVPLTNLTISSLVCLMVLHRTKQTNYVLLFIFLLTTLLVSSIVTALYRFDSFTTVSMNLLCSLINAIFSIVVALLIVPVIEKKFGYATRNVLLNLIDNTTPLLKRLAKEAKGTYYHSVIVGNLAEECAEVIGADPMLARVGSYYHDIGKLERPEFFIENNTAENPHDTMNPIESANIIKNHIKIGTLLAKKAKLPDQIIEIISQHHGDNRIKYFLHKANDLGLEVDVADFTYNGPKPQTKESAIVMIADVIESTVKSSNDHSESVIKKIIEDSINNLISDEQLNDAPITIRELATIKQTILPILCSIYKKRVEYPDET